MPIERVKIQGHLYVYGTRWAKAACGLSKDPTTLGTLQVYGTRSVPTTLRIWYEMTTYVNDEFFLYIRNFLFAYLFDFPVKLWYN